ncbi:MAG: hypothetical protein OWS74_06740, partial [Firmicutes bacterium]|nr:hypothetical protein [Bacillota bacterium]
NVGSLMAWLGGIFECAPDVLIQQGLDRLDHTDNWETLPVCLPFLNGERSPWWQEDRPSGFVNWRPRHTRKDLAASAVLGMLSVFGAGKNRLEAAGFIVRYWQGGSRLLQIPGLAAYFAGFLDAAVDLSTVTDLSVGGAARMAAYAAAWPSLPVAAPALRYAVPHEKEVTRMRDYVAHWEQWACHMGMGPGSAAKN